MLFAAALALPALVLLGACDATLEGMVLRTGNEPFSMLVLRLDDGRDLALEGPLLAKRRRHGGATGKVEETGTMITGMPSRIPSFPPS